MACGSTGVIYDALEAWSLALPHKAWWSDYLRDRGGTSFWHETYFRRGGIETMYVDTGETIGLSRVAAVYRQKARCSRRDDAPNPTGWRQEQARALQRPDGAAQESNDESLGTSTSVGEPGNLSDARADSSG